MQPFLSLMRHPPATVTTPSTVTLLAGGTACDMRLIALLLIGALASFSRAAMRHKHRIRIVRKPTVNLWGAAKRPLNHSCKSSPPSLYMTGEGGSGELRRAPQMAWAECTTGSGIMQLRRGVRGPACLYMLLTTPVVMI